MVLQAEERESDRDRERETLNKYKYQKVNCQAKGTGRHNGPFILAN